MGLSPFKRGRADVSLRVVEPDGFAQTETAAMVLGSNESGWFENLDEDDGISVHRSDLDVTGVDLLRARFRIRGSVAEPAPYAWQLHLLIDDVLYVTVPIVAGRTEDRIDVGVNVSKISGAHKFEMRLRMVMP